MLELALMSSSPLSWLSSSLSLLSPLLVLPLLASLLVLRLAAASLSMMPSSPIVGVGALPCCRRRVASAQWFASALLWLPLLVVAIVASATVRTSPHQEANLGCRGHDATS